MRRGLSAFAVAAVLAVGLTSCEGPPPSDRQLIGTFRAKRQVFETLRQKLCALPHQQTIWTDSNDDSMPKLPAAVRQDYLGLMKRIGVERVAAIPAGRDLNLPKCAFEASFWSRGFLDQGDSKDIELDPTPDKDALVLDSLDDIDFEHTVRHFRPPSSHGQRTYMRHLEGDWWLEWDHWE